MLSGRTDNDDVSIVLAWLSVRAGWSPSTVHGHGVLKAKSDILVLLNLLKVVGQGAGEDGVEWVLGNAFVCGFSFWSLCTFSARLPKTLQRAAAVRLRAEW